MDNLTRVTGILILPALKLPQQLQPGYPTAVYPMTTGPCVFRSSSRAVEDVLQNQTVITNQRSDRGSSGWLMTYYLQAYLTESKRQAPGISQVEDIMATLISFMIAKIKGEIKG